MDRGHLGDNGMIAMLAVVLDSKREFVSVPVPSRSMAVTTAVYPAQPMQKPKHAQDQHAVVCYLYI